MPSLIIKFSTAAPDLALDVPDVQIINVSWLRQQVRERIGGVLTNRRLRFIAGGKVLTPQTDFAKDVAKIDVNDKGKKPIVQDPNKRIYIHCSVGEILSPADLQREATLDSSAPNPASTTLPEPRGFDRLRNAGFSAADIAQLRRQFARSYGGDEEADGDRDVQRQEGRSVGEAIPLLGGASVVNGIESGNRLRSATSNTSNTSTNTNTAATAAGPSTNNESENQMVQMEELWLDTAATAEDQGPLASLHGDYLDDLIGLVAGMFLGVFVLFIMKEPNLFRRRQLRSVLSGVAINVTFAVIRLFS